MRSVINGSLRGRSSKGTGWDYPQGSNSWKEEVSKPHPYNLAPPTAALCLDKDLNNVLETQSEKYEQDQKLRNDVSDDFIG